MAEQKFRRKNERIDTAVIVETIEKLCMQARYQLGDDVKQL